MSRIPIHNPKHGILSLSSSAACQRPMRCSRQLTCCWASPTGFLEVHCEANRHLLYADSPSRAWYCPASCIYLASLPIGASGVVGPPCCLGAPPLERDRRGLCTAQSSAVRLANGLDQAAGASRCRCGMGCGEVRGVACGSAQGQAAGHLCQLRHQHHPRRRHHRTGLRRGAAPCRAPFPLRHCAGPPYSSFRTFARCRFRCRPSHVGWQIQLRW